MGPFTAGRQREDAGLLLYMMRIMNARVGSWVVVAGLLGVCGLGVSPMATGSEAKSSAGSGEVLNFAMLDHRGRLHELRRMGGRAVVLFFTANDCPVARQSASKLKSLRSRFFERGVEIFMVNASMADDRKNIAKEATELGVPMPATVAAAGSNTTEAARGDEEDFSAVIRLMEQAA